MWIDRKPSQYTALALLASLLLQGPAFAADNATPAQPKPSASPHERSSVNREAAAALLRERQTLVREAMVANEDMLMAIVSLEHQDKDAAYKALSDASGKLDVVLARDPHMKLVPISARLTTEDLESGPKAVKESLSQAKKQLSDGHVQVAKSLLRPLTSEIRTSIEYLPMDSYPAAIKQASQDIQAGHLNEAAALLADTLRAIVTKETIYPLPPLKAEADVQEAEALIKADPKKNQAQATDLLNQAGQQLEVGKLLGYGDYKDITKEIASVQQKLHGGSADTGLFARLKSLLHEARTKL